MDHVRRRDEDDVDFGVLDHRSHCSEPRLKPNESIACRTRRAACRCTRRAPGQSRAAQTASGSAAASGCGPGRATRSRSRRRRCGGAPLGTPRPRSLSRRRAAVAALHAVMPLTLPATPSPRARRASPPSTAGARRRSRRPRWRTPPSALGGHPLSRPWHSAPPNASPAPSPHSTWIGAGAISCSPSRSATSTPSPPSLTMASSTPALEQPARGLVRVVRADRHGALLAVADRDRCVRRRRRRSSRVASSRELPEARAVVEVEHRVAAAARGREHPLHGARGSAPGTARRRRSTGSARRRTVSGLDLVRPELEIGHRRLAAEQQLRVLGRIEHGERQRRDRLGSTPTYRVSTPNSRSSPIATSPNGSPPTLV